LKKKQNKAAAGVIAASCLTMTGCIAVMSVLMAGNNVPNKDNANAKESSVSISTNDAAESVGAEDAAVEEYTDGIWLGEGNGFNGVVKVEVTIEEGKIQSITVLENVDDYEYFSAAEEGVIQKILEQQTSEVDSVSGATFSSKGIKEAVSNALEMSKE
jgi:uncharacterized protein with FMN-binding domain